jgi:CRP/FNR family cyclic AMP-dependent transcriptional regulator
MPAETAFLHDIPLFSSMDEEELKAVAAIMEDVPFPQGTQLFHERDRGGTCYVIRSGRVELTVRGEGGEKIVVDVLDPGEVCGELSLFDGGDRSATGTALTDVQALALRRDPFLNLLRAKPDAAMDVMTVLTKRIRRADKLLRQQVRNPNDVVEQKETLGDRVADRVAAFGGSWKFIGSFGAFLVFWVVLNTVLLVRNGPIDPYPFILLNLFLSMIAALQAPVIMMSQNRQDAKDRIRSELDYSVNVRSEVEIAELHEKLDKLRGELLLRLDGPPADRKKSAGSGS